MVDCAMMLLCFVLGGCVGLLIGVLLFAEQND